MEDVARAVAVSRSTLAGLTRWEQGGCRVTNTALLEALCRFLPKDAQRPLGVQPRDRGRLLRQRRRPLPAAGHTPAN